MGYASKLGHARISSRRPQAAAVCDRCGAIYNHVDLQWQYDWGGATLINKRLLVCRSCLDEPQQQLRSIVIPADPQPIQNPRPQDFAGKATTLRTIEGSTTDFWTGIPIPGGDTRETEGGALRVTQQTGFASGSLNQEPGTDPNAPGNDDPGLPYGNDEVPNTGPIGP